MSRAHKRAARWAIVCQLAFICLTGSGCLLHPPHGQGIEVRRGGLRIAVAREMIRAERINGDKDEVHRPGLQ